MPSETQHAPPEQVSGVTHVCSSRGRGWMDGRMDGWTGVWVDGLMGGGWMDGRVDGWVGER